MAGLRHKLRHKQSRQPSARLAGLIALILLLEVRMRESRSPGKRHDSAELSASKWWGHEPVRALGEKINSRAISDTGMSQRIFLANCPAISNRFADDSEPSKLCAGGKENRARDIVQWFSG